MGLKVAKTCFAAVVDNLVALVGVPALALAATRLKEAKENGTLAKLARKLEKTKVEADASALLVAVVAAAFVVGIILRWRKASRSTYLVDFYTFRPPDRNQTSHEELRKGIRMSGVRSFVFFFEFLSKNSLHFFAFFCGFPPLLLDPPPLFLPLPPLHSAQTKSHSLPLLLLFLLLQQ